VDYVPNGTLDRHIGVYSSTYYFPLFISLFFLMAVSCSKCFMWFHIRLQEKGVVRIVLQILSSFADTEATRTRETTSGRHIDQIREEPGLGCREMGR
jgi:hypothetical protein